MIDPLPPDIEQLFAAERGTTVISDAARTSIRNKLIASIGLAPLGSAAAGTLLAAAKVLTAFVAISIGASAVRYAASPPRPKPVIHAPSPIAKTDSQPTSPLVVPPPTPVVVATPILDVAPGMTLVTAKRPAPHPVIVATPLASIDEAGSTPLEGPPISQSVTFAAPVPPATHPVTVAAASVNEAITPSAPIAPPDVVPTNVTTPPIPLAPPAINVVSPPRDAISQARLLVAAWKALAANDPQRALSLVDVDRRAHRDSPLDEERRALEIAALASTHRIGEARAASIQFFARYPNSVHRALVERAVDRKELR